MERGIRIAIARSDVSAGVQQEDRCAVSAVMGGDVQRRRPRVGRHRFRVRAVFQEPSKSRTVPTPSCAIQARLWRAGLSINESIDGAARTQPRPRFVEKG
jgi:hypothetical protein